MTALIVLMVLETLILSMVAFSFLRVRFAGTIEVIKTKDKKTLSLELEMNPDHFEKKKKVLFKIRVVSGEKELV